MVSTKSGKGFVFPKGGVEPHDESACSTAAREAMEEAGVLLKADSCTLLTHKPMYSQKRLRSKMNKKGVCQAEMYVMEVERELFDWPEANRRIRRWETIENAKELCKYKWMRDALLELEERAQEFYFGQLVAMNAPGLDDAQLRKGWNIDRDAVVEQDTVIRPTVTVPDLTCQGHTLDETGPNARQAELFSRCSASVMLMPHMF